MSDTALPDRLAIERALLDLLRDGKIHHDEEIVPSLARQFGLDLSKLAVTGAGRTKFGNEIDWVKGDLGDVGRGKKLIRRIHAKQYQILPAGLAALSARDVISNNP